MQKKLLGILLALCMLLSLCFAVSATEGEVTHLTEVPEGYTGIYDEAGLQSLMNEEGLSGNYILMTDITLTEATMQSPIGTGDDPFTGIFDGNNYSISGIAITGASGETHRALFGAAANGATLKNVTLNGTVSPAASYAAGLLGRAADSVTIQNVTSNVVVTNASYAGDASMIGQVAFNVEGMTVTLENCVNNGAITGPRWVGGMIGYINGAENGSVVITNCENNGAVKATATKTDPGYGIAGGIIGYINHSSTANPTITVTDSENNGTVTAVKNYAGGIVGMLNPNGPVVLEIIGCENTQTVSAGNNSAGGMIGGVTANAEGSDLKITECTNSGNVSGVAHIGGILGYITGLATAGDYSAETYSTSDFEISKCKNTGDISASASSAYVGGIVGTFLGANNKYYMDVVMTELYNSGTITGTNYAGAIIGIHRPTKAPADSVLKYTLTDWANVGTAPAIIGGLGAGANTIWGFSDVYSSTAAEMYIKDGGGNTVNITNTLIGASTADANIAFVKAANEGDAVWVLDGASSVPALAFTGVECTHVYAPANDKHTCACGLVEDHVVEDGVCTLCGANTSCAHANTVETNVVPSTCITAGSKDIFCNDCQSVLETVALALDPTNHETTETGFYSVAGGVAKSYACCKLDAPEYLDTYIIEGNTIDNERELLALMHTEDKATLGGDYALSSNLVLTGEYELKHASIGAENLPFTGTFDGANYTISGLNIAGTGRCGSALFADVRDAEIKDLTVSGTVTGDDSFAAGIVGKVSGNFTITNCVSEVNVVSSAACTAGIIGGINLASNNVVIKINDCINRGSVQGKTQTGGILGYVYFEKNGASVEVKGCTNETDATITTTNGGYAGGIIGYLSFSDSAAGNFSFNIENCVNKATVSATADAAAGILGGIGQLGVAKDGSFTELTLKQCANYGDISSTKNSVAGIIGQHILSGGKTHAKTTATELYNAGAVSGVSYVGSIIGIARPGLLIDGVVQYVFADWMNANADGNKLLGYIGSATQNGVTGSWTISNLYNVNGAELFSSVTNNTITVSNALKAGDTDYVAFMESDTEGAWVYRNATPTLAFLADECTHESKTEPQVVQVATCAKEQITAQVCNNCLEALEPVVGEKDADNHNAVTLGAGENGTVAYTCADCEAVISVTPNAVVYVSADSTVSFNGDGVDFAAIGTEAMPFATLEDAMVYAAAALANGDATVKVVGAVAVPELFQTPNATNTLTIEGAGEGAQLTFPASKATLFANGPLVVDNIHFEGLGDTVIAAQENKLVLGNGVTTNGKQVTPRFVVAGGYAHTVYASGSSTIETKELNTDITVRGGIYRMVTGANFRMTGTYTGNLKVTLGNTTEGGQLDVALPVPFSIYGTAASTGVAAEGTVHATVIIDGAVGNVDEYYVTTMTGAAADGTYTVDLVLKGDITEDTSSATDVVITAAATSGTAAKTTYNIYVDSRVTDPDSEKLVAEIRNKIENVNAASYQVYCLEKLNPKTEENPDGHVDANADKVCDECAANFGCDHEMTDVYVIVDATCNTAGSGYAKCAKCDYYDANQPVVIEPATTKEHEAIEGKWQQNGNAYDYVCICGTVLDTQAQAVYYVDAYGAGGRESGIGDDAYVGYLREAPLKTISEAVQRLADANVEGIVWIIDRYDIDGKIILPEHEKTITFRTDLNEEGGTRQSFVVPTNNSVLSLGGPTKFENIQFNGRSTKTVQNDACYYNEIFFVANWNDVTFGDNIDVWGAATFVGGRYGSKLASDTAESPAKNATFVFNKLSTGNVSTAVKQDDGSYAPSSSYNYPIPAYFKTMFLGDRCNSATNIMDTYNTTLDATFNGMIVGDIYAASANAKGSQSVNTVATLNFNGNAEMGVLRTGGSNNFQNGNAYMDALTVNFNDNSTASSASLRNVRDLTINVSELDSGRTTLFPGNIYARLTTGYVDGFTVDAGKETEKTYLANTTGAEKLTATYSTHSFAQGMGVVYDDTSFNTDTVYDPAKQIITLTVTDKCEGNWSDWEVTTPATSEADGIKTRVCAVCQKTEEMTYKFNCDVHTFVKVVDGETVTYVCDVCDAETTEAPTAAVVYTATVGEDGKVSIHVTGSAFAIAEFYVNIPEGWTLTGIENALAEATTESTGWTLTAPEADDTGAYVAPYKFILLNLPVERNLVDGALDQVVAVLTVAPAETAKAGNLTITAGDAHNVAEEYLTVASVGTVLELPPCAHNYEEVADSAVAPTCATAGKEADQKCTLCGDVVTGKEIPATGEHNYEEVAGSAVAPTCATAGKEADQKCSVCGDEVTGKEIPATGEHVWGNWVETVAPQVGVAGEQRRDCDNCDAFETEEVPALEPEEPEVYVAYIGETGYATVQAAVEAVKMVYDKDLNKDVLGTITVEKGTKETIDPSKAANKAFWLEGDFSGITFVNSDYMIHSNPKDDFDGDIKVKRLVRPVEETAITISGTQNLSLESAILMNFFGLSTTMRDYADAYAVMTINKGAGDATEKTYIVTDYVDGPIPGQEVDGYRFTFPTVAAKEMNDTVTCRIYAIDTEGNVFYRDRSASIVSYCKSVWASGNTAAKNLYAAILNYGTAAQNAFGYKTDTPANALLDELGASTYKKTLSTDFAKTLAEKTNDKKDVEGITNILYGQTTNMTALGEILLNITLVFSDENAKLFDELTMVATYTGEDDGKSDTLEIPSSEWEPLSEYSSGYQQTKVALGGIAARNLRSTVTYTLYRNYDPATKTGKQVNGYRMVGAEENVQRVIATNSGKEKDLALLKSILAYCDAAAAYFN